MRLDCDSNSSFPVCPWLLEKLAPLSFFFTVVKFLPFSFHHSSGSQCVILPQSALTCPCSPPPGVFLCFEFLLEFFPTLKSVVNFRRPNLPALHWSFGVKEMILHVTNRMTSLIVLNLSLQFAEQPSPQTSGSKLHTEKIYHLMFKVKENFTFFKYIFCLFVGVLGVFEGKLGVTPAKTYKLHWFTQQRRDRGLKIRVCQRGKKTEWWGVRVKESQRQVQRTGWGRGIQTSSALPEFVIWQQHQVLPLRSVTTGSSLQGCFIFFFNV